MHPLWHEGESEWGSTNYFFDIDIYEHIISLTYEHISSLTYEHCLKSISRWETLRSTSNWTTRRRRGKRMLARVLASLASSHQPPPRPPPPPPPWSPPRPHQDCQTWIGNIYMSFITCLILYMFLGLLWSPLLNQPTLLETSNLSSTKVKYHNDAIFDLGLFYQAQLI